MRPRHSANSGARPLNASVRRLRQRLRKVTTSTLGEILLDWGRHEAPVRGRSQSVDLEDDRAVLSFILWFRAPYIGRIMTRRPMREALVVELETGDAEALFLADGRSLRQWRAAVTACGGDAREHLTALAEGTRQFQGKLVAEARVDSAAQAVGPIVLYDGWHRAAAWAERMEQGRESPITAHLILTEGEDPLLELESAAF